MPPCSYAKISHACPQRSRTRSAFLQQTIGQRADPTAAPCSISRATQADWQSWPRKILGLGENLSGGRGTVPYAGLTSLGVGRQRPIFGVVEFTINYKRVDRELFI